ncbi:hypothetical protein ACPCSC_30740 [Streptomyces lavendulocolor]|uniref:hypothetical protein n=1 Tax=Streptomyces lavendulocolor TaxID=67316 RepID=UPI003C2B5E58
MDAIYSYGEGGDSLGVLGLYWAMRNKAEMHLVIEISKCLGAGTSWEQIAQALGMDVSEAQERWAGVAPTPSK